MFSEPMFEMLVLLFTNTSNPIRFESDTDIYGKTLCRPQGYATFFFDHEGRNWLRDGQITLEQPATPDDCFEMLAEGSVDGVVMNEFTGRKKIKDLNLAGQALHEVAHKSHPDAEQLMAMVNGGLEEIKANGAYQRVIDEHMTRIWSEF